MSLQHVKDPAKQTYYQRHRERLIEASKRNYRKRHPGKTKEYIQRAHAKNPNARYRYQLKVKYGITLEEYSKRLGEQGGVCAVCGKPPKNQRLGVDHDHRTGAIRGLLCKLCNFYLFYYEQQGVLRQLARYLGVV